MADYSNSKGAFGGVYPETSVGGAAWKRTEPLITPQQLRRRMLLGIPLVSFMKDPITGKPIVVTDDDLQDFIVRAVAMAETETGATIFPEQFNEKQPFDRNEYESFGFFKLMKRPVSSVEEFAVTPANNIDVFSVPLDWVETSYLVRGQLNIVPLTIALTAGGGVVNSQGGGGAVFLSILGNKPWVPAFWRIKYTAGYPDGAIPIIVNELIGSIAAMDVLSQLAATYARSSSASLSVDGLSQSVSTPGPQIYVQRCQELAETRKKLVKKIKTMVGLNIFSGNV